MKSLKRITKLIAVLSLITLGITLTGVAALAHERRSVDKYQLTVGFINAPAIEGQKPDKFKSPKTTLIRTDCFRYQGSSQ